MNFTYFETTCRHTDKFYKIIIGCAAFATIPNTFTFLIKLTEQNVKMNTCNTYITYSPRIHEQKRECPMSMSQFAQKTPPYTYIIRSKTIVIAAKC